MKRNMFLLSVLMVVELLLFTNQAESRPVIVNPDFQTNELPPIPKEWNKEEIAEYGRNYNPLNFRPQSFRVEEIPLSEDNEIEMTLLKGKYAQGEQILIILEDVLDAVARPLVQEYGALIREKFGARVKYFVVHNLTDGAHQKMRLLIRKKKEDFPKIISGAVFVSRDILPRWEHQESFDGTKLKLVNFPFWFLYFSDLDTRFRDTDGNGILDKRVGGTHKLEMPVMVYPLGLTPKAGTPEELVKMHFQNFIEWTTVGINFPNGPFTLICDANFYQGMSRYAKEAFGDIDPVIDQYYPYRKITEKKYREIYFTRPEIGEEISAHGSSGSFVLSYYDKLGEQRIGQITYDDFLFSKPDKKFMILRSCSSMECQLYYFGCLGMSVANSGHVLSTMGNSKIGNFISLKTFYFYLSQGLSMEEAVLNWINYMIENNSIGGVMQWMGGLSYIGLPLTFVRPAPSTEESSLKE